MKVMPVKGFADAVKSQESPPTQANVTEIPPTPPTQWPQDERSLNVSGAAAYRNPEASITSYDNIIYVDIICKYLISVTSAIKHVYQLVCIESLWLPWNTSILS